MFTSGDAVVHANYGTGVVKGKRTITRDGKDKRYFCIELSEDRGMLMIPMDRLEDSELRPALDDMSIIRKVIHTEPEDLSDHHRSRQNTLESMISTGKPRQLATVLRDLAWRRRLDKKITATDKKLETKAQKRLMQELAVGMSVTTTTIRQKLTNLLSEAMDKHHTAEAAPAS